ncbi:hypothetical protein P5673_030275 [Acropora cervicornis]|uniref:Uncharacterized protein n=1 Tax=Acropora cervicornis TaxID=6130 RepID=A0AAD9UTN4_ACRCE|nr:hypothetical protein P5673_030275 [Acropora cervicornis]
MCKENLGWDDVTVSDDLQYLFRQSKSPPLKAVTMPRLELTTTTVTVKQQREEHPLQIHKVTFWTDSTIVLQYIKNSHSRFQKFVATIHDLSSPS